MDSPNDPVVPTGLVEPQQTQVTGPEPGLTVNAIDDDEDILDLTLLNDTHDISAMQDVQASHNLSTRPLNDTHDSVMQDQASDLSTRPFKKRKLNEVSGSESGSESDSESHSDPFDFYTQHPPSF